MAEKKLVIIGCGFAGKAVAKHLDKKTKIDITVIDKREAFAFKIGGPRASTDPSFQDTCLRDFDGVFKRATMIKGVAAERVDGAAKLVHLADGRDVPYDFLLVSTGSTNASVCEPRENTIAGIKQAWTESAEAVGAAKNVVVVGGGPVGIELAGEIRDSNPEAKITIVSSADRLLPNLGYTGADTPTTFSDALLDACKQRNIDVVFGTKVTLPDDIQAKGYVAGAQTLATTGTPLECDLVFTAIGIKPNSLEGLPLDERGAIKVQPNLQVEGMDGVFCTGDASNFDCPKLAPVAGGLMGPMMPPGQANVVVANIIALNAGKPADKVFTYKPSSSMVIVPLGTRSKPTVAPTFGVPWLMKGMVVGMKRKDYFAGPHIDHLRK